MNQIYINGKVVSKPAIQYENYLPETFLLVAVEEEGQAQLFFDVLVRGKHAETCFNKLIVGSQILVEGRFYVCKDSTLRILADRVQIME